MTRQCVIVHHDVDPSRHSVEFPCGGMWPLHTSSALAGPPLTAETGLRPLMPAGIGARWCKCVGCARPRGVAVEAVPAIAVN